MSNIKDEIDNVLHNRKFIVSSETLFQFIQNNLISETQGLELAFMLSQSGTKYESDVNMNFTPIDPLSEKDSERLNKILYEDEHASDPSSSTYQSPTKTLLYKRLSIEPTMQLTDSISELSSSPEQVSIPTSSELLTMFEFSQALSYINSHCEKEDADWHNQLQYINAFRYLVQNQLSTFHHYLKHYLPNIRLYLGSIRSIVSKSAMIAFKELFETLHTDALVDFNENLHIILLKATGDKAFIKVVGEETLHAIATHCNDPLVYATLCSYLKDKNPKIQALVVKTIFQLFTTYTNLLSSIDLSVLYKELPLLINSKSSDCRSTTRELVAWFVQMKGELPFRTELESLSISQYDINSIFGASTPKPKSMKVDKRSSLRDFIRSQKKSIHTPKTDDTSSSPMSQSVPSATPTSEDVDMNN